jgi:hypothetical protein
MPNRNWIFLILLTIFACDHAQQRVVPMPKKNPAIEETLNKNTGALMKIPGVIGTAIGEDRGKPCIIIMVDPSQKAWKGKLPQTLGGYPVKVEEIGPVKALKDSSN